MLDGAGGTSYSIQYGQDGTAALTRQYAYMRSKVQQGLLGAARHALGNAVAALLGLRDVLPDLGCSVSDMPTWHWLCTLLAVWLLGHLLGRAARRPVQLRAAGWMGQVPGAVHGARRAMPEELRQVLKAQRLVPPACCTHDLLLPVVRSV